MSNVGLNAAENVSRVSLASHQQKGKKSNNIYIYYFPFSWLKSAVNTISIERNSDILLIDYDVKSPIKSTETVIIQWLLMWFMSRKCDELRIS